MISLEFKDDRQAKNKTGIIIILRAGLLFSEIEVVMTARFVNSMWYQVSLHPRMAFPVITT